MKKRRFICFAIFILTVISCAPKDKLKISLSEDQLVDIMFDIRVAEQIIIKEPSDTRDSLRIQLRSDLEKIHKIPYNEIEFNLIEIQKDPIFMERLNNSLQEKFKLFEQTLE